MATPCHTPNSNLTMLHFFGSDICPGLDLLFIGSSTPLNVTAINVTGFGETTCNDVTVVLYPSNGLPNSIPAYVCASLRGEVGDTCCSDPNPMAEEPTIAPEDDSATVAPNSPTASPDTATKVPSSPAASLGFPILTVGMMLAGASFMTALN